jgi:AraC family transcriptional regulator, regulatory protein of adaptative response / methylated-DNA-[protein]-cysteine methyltransferase
MKQNVEPNVFSTDDQRWSAVLQKDQRADGVFYTAVKTTGIYCRPICPSRLPLRKNVIFFASPEEAETAGFRACKRCQPKKIAQTSPNEAAIIATCQMIDQAGSQPRLADLAAAVGLSPFYFQRLFKKQVGITPKQYFQEKRSQRMRDNLQQNERVSDAIYDSGFGSNSRFYSQTADSLGMRPVDFQKGAPGQRISYACSPCFLGWVLVAATEIGICEIDFGDNPEMLEKKLFQRFTQAVFIKDNSQFIDQVKRVISYVETPDQELNLPLDILGTAFQRRVWMALRDIPYGKTASYSDIAQKIGKPKAVRAVAHACASNSIAVAIPCHRVVRTDGSLGGYRWGLERKRVLLAREKELSDQKPS